jgi:hypothetical protein
MNHTYSRRISKAVVTCLATALVFGLIGSIAPSQAVSQSVAFQISGDGVIGEDSVEVGKDFSLDLYLTNSSKLLGFTLGFQMTGKNGLKSVTHLWPQDTTGKKSKDLESNITAYNGFESTTYWDMGQLQKPVYSWDGKLPDSLLLGGVAMNKGWPKTSKPTHYVSIALKANQAGSVCIDSAFIPPSGAWLFAPKTRPDWGGEYCVTAVGGNPCAGKGKGKK